MQKYDIAKPTYAKWASTGLRLGIPQHGFAAILAKRCVSGLQGAFGCGLRIATGLYVWGRGGV